MAGAPGCAGHVAEQQAGPPPATSTAGQPVQADSVKLASDQVADSLLVDVRSLDPAILVDLRYATANNFTGAVLPGYQAQKALLRREAAQALARVEARLRTAGLGLRIWDAYRPLRATMAMVAWAESTGRTDLLDQEYIARRSRHNLGVAVDLTLVDFGYGNRAGPRHAIRHLLRSRMDGECRGSRSALPAGPGSSNGVGGLSEL